MTDLESSYVFETLDVVDIVHDVNEAEMHQKEIKEIEKQLEALLMLEQETNKLVDSQSDTFHHVEDAIQQIKVKTIESEKHAKTF